jgi:hypothetical protein
MAEHENTRSAYESLVPHLKGVEHWEDLIIDGMVILKFTLKKECMKD